MRGSPSLALVALLALAAACAREHEYRQYDPDDEPPLEPSHTGPRGFAPVLEGGVPRADGGALAWPFGEPPFPAEGGLPFPWDAGGLADASSPFDSSLPGNPIVQRPGPLVPITLRAACPSTSPAPQPQGCRISPWHTPACYRPPVDCKAAQEPFHCITQTGNAVTFIGLSQAQRCIAQLPMGAPSASFGQLGGEVLRCTQKSVQKVALSDGSMDVAPIPCSAVFTMNGAILVHGASTTAVARYDSWDDLQAGKGVILAYASPSALFGANSTHMVAMWPGSNQADILASDGSATRRLFLPGLQGQVQGVDLTDDEQLIATTPKGLWVFDAVTGELLKLIESDQLNGVGLSCQGSPSSASAVSLNRRPLPAPAAQLIVQVERCAGRQFSAYSAERGGPELIVIGNNGGTLTTVRDERSSPHTLVLSADGPSVFQIENRPGSKLERIIVTGDGGASVELSASPVPVEYRRDTQSLGLLYDPWYSANGSEFRDTIEKYTGRKITESSGCWGNASFVLRDVSPLCP